MNAYEQSEELRRKSEAWFRQYQETGVIRISDDSPWHECNPQPQKEEKP